MSSQWKQESHGRYSKFVPPATTASMNSNSEPRNKVPVDDDRINETPEFNDINKRGINIQPTDMGGRRTRRKTRRMKRKSRRHRTKNHFRKSRRR